MPTPLPSLLLSTPLEGLGTPRAGSSQALLGRPWQPYAGRKQPLGWALGPQRSPESVPLLEMVLSPYFTVGGGGFLKGTGPPIRSWDSGRGEGFVPVCLWAGALTLPWRRGDPGPSCLPGFLFLSGCTCRGCVCDARWPPLLSPPCPWAELLGLGMCPCLGSGWVTSVFLCVSLADRGSPLVTGAPVTSPEPGEGSAWPSVGSPRWAQKLSGSLGGRPVPSAARSGQVLPP